MALPQIMQQLGATRGTYEDGGDSQQDSGGLGFVGDQLSTESDLCTQPRKRRRLVGSKEPLVRGESELAEEHSVLLITDELISSSEEETSQCDSTDESGTEEEGSDRLGRLSDRWGVAFRKASELPWTDAQWVAYWREQGYFLIPGEPFPFPFL